MGHGRPGGTRRETATESVVQNARGIRSPGRMESGETRIRKRRRRCDTTNRGCFCASWIGRVQRHHSIHCRGAGRSSNTACGKIRKLQARLILNDNGDKVIFRQFGGKSSLRTLESGHTAIRADQFDPDGWQLPEIAELCQNNDQGFLTNCMSVIAHLHHSPQQKVPSNDNETARSHRTNLLTSSSRFKLIKQMNCSEP